jgi:NADH dehydrogenase
MNLNLVVGATGFLGSEICRLLLEDARPLRALVRTTSDPATVDRLGGLGAETVDGDLRDPASLERACAGAAAVLSTATSIARGESLQATDIEGQRNLIDAAAGAGVGRFVFISFLQVAVQIPLQDAKRAVERHLQESGVPYTILRPSFFMEFWLGPPTGWDLANGRIRVLGPGDRPLSYVSLGDVAKIAVAVLDRCDAENSILEFAGDYAAPNDLVAALEDAGRQVDVEHVPLEALRAEHEAAQDPLGATFSGLSLAAALGTDDLTAAIRTHVPEPLTARSFLIDQASPG